MKNIDVKSKGKINAVVLMSGGVDSAAAALLLIRGGYAVAGLTMEYLFDHKARASLAAARICHEIGIEHRSVDLSKEFAEHVTGPFYRSYKLGRTPNPCADCNEKIKFGLLWDFAAYLWGGNILFATGHYAALAQKGGKTFIARSANKAKDQSYFLGGVNPSLTDRLIFPIGKFASKEAVRKIVREAGLSVSNERESMEICFTGGGDYRALPAAVSPPGPITDKYGVVIGRHNGITSYTIGQRKGLGIAANKPLFVTEIRPHDNTIVVSSRTDAFVSWVTAARANIFSKELASPGVQLFGKIRSQGEPRACTIRRVAGGILTVAFDDPVFAPAPGQRLVLYTREGLIVASGVIFRSGKNSK